MKRGMTVLLVEDDPSHAEEVRRALAKWPEGCQVVRTDRLSTTLERLSKGDIDLVLLDLSLPDSQGLDTFLSVRTHTAKLPVVIVTMFDDDALARAALPGGVRDYVVKGRLDGGMLERIIRSARELRDAQEELRKAHEQTEQLLTSISSILIGVDRHGVIAKWNAVAAATFGLPAPRVVNQPLEGAGILWEAARVQEGIASCRRTGQTTRLEHLRFTRQDGTQGWVGLTINPIRDTSGELSGFLILGADITERVQVQAAFDAKLQELELLNRIMMGREERILELKDEIRALRVQLAAQVGSPPAAPPH